MIERSGPFDSIDGDRLYAARWFSGYFTKFISDGIFLGKDNPECLQVFSNNDFTVKVKEGAGFIKGNDYELEGDMGIVIEPADNYLDRIDRIVLQRNLDNVTGRDIRVKYKKGSPASSPVAPALIRDNIVYELSLAEITVKRGAGTITQGDIRDTRHITDLCGISKAIAYDFDGKSIYIQYEDILNKKIDLINKIIEQEGIGGEILALLDSKQDKILKDRVNGNKFEFVVENNRPFLEVKEIG